jgi:glutamine synthetase
LGTRPISGPEAEFFVFDNVKFSDKMNKVSFEVDAEESSGTLTRPMTAAIPATVPA